MSSQLGLYINGKKVSIFRLRWQADPHHPGRAGATARRTSRSCCGGATAIRESLGEAGFLQWQAGVGAGQGQQAHEVLAVPRQPSWDLTRQGWARRGRCDPCAGGRNRNCQQCAPEQAQRKLNVSRLKSKLRSKVLVWIRWRGHS